MNLRLSFTIIVSKILILALRLLRSGGTTLPGKVAYKIYPGIIKVISRNFKIIMVTGTNGKTTTTRIIGEMLNESGITHVTNKSGANLVSGVITTLIEAVDISGKSKASTALIEVDEAAFNLVTDYVQPDIIVVTNFFRDQLDRYGELYTTLNGVKAGIQKSPNARLVLNADDSLCASLGKDATSEVLYYGFDSKAYESPEKSLNSDATFCIYCKNKYEYSNRIYGHLGGFICNTCGYRRPEPQVTCVSVEELNSSYSNVVFSSNCQKADNKPVTINTKINLPGLYNIYNALASTSLGCLLNIPGEILVKSLESFECGFGRMETIVTQGKNIKLILVKNPTGFNQVINYLLTEDKTMQIAFIINDKLADGTDISWLWDVDFEKLCKVQETAGTFYTSGIRAEDMAVRLKYAGIYSNRIKVIKNYEELINSGLSNIESGQSFYILPTYTSMLEIRSFLKKKYGLKEFWK